MGSIQLANYKRKKKMEEFNLELTANTVVKATKVTSNDPDVQLRRAVIVEYEHKGLNKKGKVLIDDVALAKILSILQ